MPKHAKSFAGQVACATFYSLSLFPLRLSTKTINKYNLIYIYILYIKKLKNSLPKTFQNSMTWFNHANECKFNLRFMFLLCNLARFLPTPSMQEFVHAHLMTILQWPVYSRTNHFPTVITYKVQRGMPISWIVWFRRDIEPFEYEIIYTYPCWAVVSALNFL